MLLVTGLSGYEDVEDVGWLVTPRSRESLRTVSQSGRAFACDNDAFGAWDEARYLRMLSRVSRMDNLLWVTAPDVVGDHEATLERWREWRREFHPAYLPPAFVLQDGATVDTVPWGEVAAVFVGGSTEWKLGPRAAALVAEGKRRGLWVHMGRVNSVLRMDYARTLGCDSVDGTQWSRFRAAYKRLAVTGLARARQLGMGELLTA